MQATAASCWGSTATGGEYVSPPLAPDVMTPPCRSPAHVRCVGWEDLPYAADVLKAGVSAALRETGGRWVASPDLFKFGGVPNASQLPGQIQVVQQNLFE